VVGLYWVLGHAGVRENEIADELARGGSALRFLDPERDLGVSRRDVQKSFYLHINQLDALNFIMSLFHASTYVENMCSSSGGQNCTIQPLVSSH
jgi:hypothetical protein